MKAQTESRTVLKDDALYLGDNGNVVCAATHCAGMTARHTGRTIAGQKAERVDVDHVTEWATYDLGPMTCMCGAVTLTAVAGPDGWPLAR